MSSLWCGLSCAPGYTKRMVFIFISCCFVAKITLGAGSFHTCFPSGLVFGRPPQGWRSWNLYGANVNQSLITSVRLHGNTTRAQSQYALLSRDETIVSSLSFHPIKNACLTIACVECAHMRVEPPSPDNKHTLRSLLLVPDGISATKIDL